MDKERSKAVIPNEPWLWPCNIQVSRFSCSGIEASDGSRGTGQDQPWPPGKVQRTELVSDVLSNSVAARDPGPGVIFRSDRGCQHTSAAYAALAEEVRVTLSLGRTGRGWDNALAESLLSSLKGELTGTRAWPTRAGARRAVVDYITISLARALPSWCIRRMHPGSVTITPDGSIRFGRGRRTVTIPAVPVGPSSRCCRSSG